jgi:hypothetical protein
MSGAPIGMARARRLYFLSLSAAIGLFGASAWLSAARPEVGSSGALLHFGIFVVAIGAAAATWGTAVAIASVHRVVWPLVAATITLVAGLGATAAWWIPGG